MQNNDRELYNNEPNEQAKQDGRVRWEAYAKTIKQRPAFCDALALSKVTSLNFMDDEKKEHSTNTALHSAANSGNAAAIQEVLIESPEKPEDNENANQSGPGF